MPFNPSSKCLTITRGNIQYLMLWVQPMKKENGWRKVFYLTQKIILIYCVNISSKIIFLCTGSCLVKTYKNLQNHAGSFTYHPLTFCCHQGKKGGGDSNQFSQIVKLMFYSYSHTFMNIVILLSTWETNVRYHFHQHSMQTASSWKGQLWALCFSPNVYIKVIFACIF